MAERRWKTLGGEPVQDIARWVREASSGGQVVHVGTDSLQTGRWTQFVTVIVIHTPGKGGRVSYSREAVTRIVSLRERLLKEVWRSVEIALTLEAGPNPMSIHIDASPEEKNLSSKYLQELAGMVMGNGFKAVVKPDAWAASHSADWVVRHKGKIPRDGPQAALKAAMGAR